MKTKISTPHRDTHLNTSITHPLPALPVIPDLEKKSTLKVCIASPDFVGPVRNGGVGTAFTALGEALAAAGHQVTLLFLGGDWCENLTIDYWIEDYARKGINFVPLPSPTDFEVDAVWSIKKAYEAYLWLRDKEFDVIHFSEWCGPGYFCMLAKRQGLAFGKTTFCVHTHGPTLWHKLSNGDYLENVLDLQLDFMERKSVLMADVLVTPSNYLIEWMKGQKWTLPEKVYLQQYVMPRTARAVVQNSKSSGRQINEIVFFGRLEERKGLILFCDALDRLANQRLKPFTITFLGKIATVQGVNSVEYIRKRSEKWPWPYQIISDKDQPGALKYLQRQGVMAVMPSLADNLPNTVLECLGGRIPFLASNAGGIPEMIAPDDISRVCFELRPDDFAEKMRKAILSGLAPARMAIDVLENERAWVRWHDQSLPGVKANAITITSPRTISQPLISICIPHYNRPTQLHQAINSIENQSYPNYEVVVVDDGSTQPEAKAYLKELEKKFIHRGWQIHYQKNSYPGAARNHAARVAKGEYLFFMDDDNLAKPNEIETFVKVAQTSGAGILTCMSDIFFEGQNPLETSLTGFKRWLFLGSAPALGLFINCFGDMNSMIRKDVFEQIGGFTEDYGIGYEDWEFFAKASLLGHEVEVIPEALFWYRKTLGGVNDTTPLHANHLRVARPYLEYLPASMRNLVFLAQGMRIKNEQLHTTLANIKFEKERPSELESLLLAGEKLLQNNEFDSARKVYSLALRQAQDLKDPMAAMKCLVGIGVALEGLHATDLAIDIYNSAKKIAVETFNLGVYDELLQSAHKLISPMHEAEGVDAEELYRLIINSDDLVRTLTQYESVLNDELVNIVKKKSVQFLEQGETELAQGLEELAVYIGEIIRQRDAVGQQVVTIP